MFSSAVIDLRFSGCLGYLAVLLPVVVLVALAVIPSLVTSSQATPGSDGAVAGTVTTTGVVSCGDKRWQLDHFNAQLGIHSSNADRLKMSVNIWMHPNVTVYPSSVPHIVNISAWDSSISPKSLSAASQSCNGNRSKRIGAPVFTACPCVPRNATYVSCPAQMQFFSSSPPNQKLTQTDDLLLIFNSWGSNSLYHLVMDTLFPLWITVHRLKTQFSIKSDRITFLNTSPSHCPDEPHVKRLKPLLDVLYGPFIAYENVSGTLANTFSNSLHPRHYAWVVYGFEFPMKLYYNHFVSHTAKQSYAYIPELGNHFNQFTVALGSALRTAHANEKPTSLMIGESTITLIGRNGTLFPERILSQTTERLLQTELQKFGHTVRVAHFGEGSLRDMSAQATYSYQHVHVLLGVEGAGFVQQIFMQPQRILVILHGFKRQRNAQYRFPDEFRWHEPAARYLGHSVINIILHLRLDQLTPIEVESIAAVSSIGIGVSKRAQARKKSVICDVDILRGEFARFRKTKRNTNELFEKIFCTNHQVQRDVSKLPSRPTVENKPSHA